MNLDAIKALPAVPTITKCTAKQQRDQLVISARLLAAVEAVTGADVHTLAKRADTATKAAYIRVARSSLGVVARIVGAGPTAVQIASGDVLARGPFTDGATWALKEGWAKCAPMIEAIEAEFSRMPEPEPGAVLAMVAMLGCRTTQAKPQREQLRALGMLPGARFDDVKTITRQVPWPK